MSLTKNISNSSEEKLLKEYSGKYNNANKIVGANLNYIKDEKTDDSTISLKSKSFFQDVFKKTNSHNLAYRILKLNETTCCVVIPKFITNKRKLDIVSKPDDYGAESPYCRLDIPFSDTFEKFNASLICNGNQVFPYILPHPDRYKIYGKVYQNNIPLFPVSSVKTTNLFAFSLFTHSDSSTSFLFYSPNSIEDGPNNGNGLGGLTPVLFEKIGGAIQKYGGLDDTGTDVIPNDAYNRLLKYDLNKNNASRKKTGKHLFAYKNQDGTGDTLKHDIALIIINENDEEPGFNIDEIRDDLYNLGFEFATGMDGSSSVFLYEKKAKPEYHIGETIKDYFIDLPYSEAAWKNFINILRTAYAIK